MHARVTHFKGDPAQIEEGIRVIKDTILPSAKKMAGFKAGYWVVDRKAGKGFAITIFESEAALKASEDAAAKTRETVSAAGGTKITGVERYEVVANA